MALEVVIDRLVRRVDGLDHFIFRILEVLFTIEVVAVAIVEGVLVVLHEVVVVHVLEDAVHELTLAHIKFVLQCVELVINVPEDLGLQHKGLLNVDVDMLPSL